MQHRVFVYGTLKTNLPNYHFLTNSESGKSKMIGMGTTVGKYPLVIGSPACIPFVLDKPGHGEVRGEGFKFALLVGQGK